jgi:hypothetical protein
LAYRFKEPPSETHKGIDREKIKLNKDGEKVKNWAVSIRILWNGISSGLNLKLDFAPWGGMDGVSGQFLPTANSHKGIYH